MLRLSPLWEIKSPRIQRKGTNWERDSGDKAWTLIKTENKPKGSGILNNLFYKRDHLTLFACKSHTDYANQYQQLLCEILEISSAIKIVTNESIYRFHAGQGKNYSSYNSRYTQTHDVFDKDNDAAYTLDYAIRRFLNTCDDPSSLHREVSSDLHALASVKLAKTPTVKCTYCGKYRHKEDKCWLKHPNLKAEHPKKKSHSKKKKRDESIEAEEDPKTNYVAVDEARYFVALHDLTDPVNVCYVTESTSLLHTPATKPDFALDTACSQHSFHDRSVLTSYQDLPYPQEINVGMHDVMIMIGQHGRSVHEVIPAYLWGKGDSHFFSCIIIT